MNNCEHIELSTDAPEQAVTFYSKVFGWKIQGIPMPEGTYHMFATSNGGGGVTAKSMPEQPTAWLPYITVKSVKTSLGEAAKHGGVTVQPYTSMGDMGAIAVVRDPTGGHIGLFEAGKGRAAQPPPARKTASRKTGKAAKTPAKPVKKKKKKG